MLEPAEAAPNTELDQLISDLDYATLLTLDDLEALLGRVRVALEIVREDGNNWHDVETYPPIGNPQHPDYAKQIQILGTITMPEARQVSIDNVDLDGERPSVDMTVQAQIAVTHWRAA